MPRFNSLDDWLSWQEGIHPRAIDLGLERAAGVFKALNPDNIKPLTIVVAGTNGKGSSVAFLEAIYRAQGYRVGTYTSPHILKYNERIKIDGQPVSDSMICRAFERIEAVRHDVSLSYFEFGTLAALDIFWQSNLDIQLLEIGLGGRLDAVNIIDSDATLITSICIDHVDWLGETRESIGYEKAGVFRKNISAIIGDPEPPQSLIDCAIEKKSPLRRIGKEFSFQKKVMGWDWFCQADRNISFLNLPEPALKGEHQYRNASAALMTVVDMESLLPVSEESVRQGLQSAHIKGRFQLIKGDVPVLLDVAHNPQAVDSLFNFLLENYANKKIYAVFSMMKDKDIKGVIDIISPTIYHWYISPINNSSRAVTEPIMQGYFDQCHLENVSFGYKSFSESYYAARNCTKTGDLIVVFGSFLLVSEYFLNISKS
jgi:dihydrofolate synthase/folylpolyglutamate synthase